MSTASPTPCSLRAPALRGRAKLCVAVVLVTSCAWVSVAFASCQRTLAPTTLSDALRAVEVGLPQPGALTLGSDADTVLQVLDAATSTSERYEPALRAVARIYGEPLADDAGPAALLDWATRAAAGVTAYGVFVVDEASGAIVATGAYWVSPLVDRLHVVRPPARAAAASASTSPEAPPGTTAGATPDPAMLAAVGSCLVPVRDWIVIPATVARDLLNASGETHAYLVGRTEPDGAPQARWIAGDELLAAAAFEHPATTDLVSFSAWFAGSGGPGPMALARAVPRVRSTLGPGDLWSLIRGIR